MSTVRLPGKGKIGDIAVQLGRSEEQYEACRRLSFAGRRLRREETLEEIGIADRATVDEAGGLLGGTRPAATTRARSPPARTEDGPSKENKGDTPPAKPGAPFGGQFEAESEQAMEEGRPVSYREAKG